VRIKNIAAMIIEKNNVNFLPTISYIYPINRDATILASIE
jgi:hypothetical protein